MSSIASEVKPINWATLTSLQSMSFAKFLNANATSIFENQWGKFRIFDFLGQNSAAIDEVREFVRALGIPLENPNVYCSISVFDSHTGVAFLTDNRGQPQPGLALSKAVNNARLFKDIENIVSYKYGYALRGLPDRLEITGQLGKADFVKEALSEQGIDFELIEDDSRGNIGIAVSAENIAKLTACMLQARHLSKKAPRPREVA